MLRVNEEDLSDVILLSAVNVKRNYADLAFPPKLDDEGRKEAKARAKQALLDAFPGLVPVQTELNDETPDSFESMMEDLAFFAEDAPKLWDVRLTVSSEPRALITLNRGDHLNVTSFRKSEGIMAALSMTDTLERALSARAPFAFDENWGYLTSDPAYAGNALTGAYLMQLTGLQGMDRIGDEAKALEQKGLILHQVWNEDDEDSEIYLLRTATQLGKNRFDVLSRLREEGEALVMRERDALEELLKDDEESFADGVMRGIGTLTYARLMPYDEFVTLYSMLRPGLILGMLQGNLRELDAFMLDMSPERLITQYGDISEREEMLLRADAARKKFSEDIKPNIL
ncbi:MAG: hypothetical protein IK140_01690 [Clostridia bacterium]|nr:hypothetical protein [Clostridia bacterium]